MFVLSEFIIEGFWNDYNIKCDLSNDVNIFVGYNGTGKTTMINTLHAVLTVDIALLHSLTFKKVTLKLKKGSMTKTVTAERQTGDSFYDIVKYKISREPYEILLSQNEQELRNRFSPRHYRSLLKLRDALESIVSVSWLSVHRQTIQEDTLDTTHNNRRTKERFHNPIDTRLGYLLGRLSDYHLSLQAKSNDLSEKFQKEVLQSLLYKQQFDTFDKPKAKNIDFDKIREHLYHAYEALGFTTAIRKTIDEHAKKIEESIKAIHEHSDQNKPLHVNDVMPVSLLKRTEKIVELSISADDKKRELFQLLNLFISTINVFFQGKKLMIDPLEENGLVIKTDNEKIDFYQLSSGEKQLFILLSETVLQNRKKSIFIADEPELSLHVAWQKQLIIAVRDLNPNAQLLIATHSPEIAGPWRQSIIKMKNIISKTLER